MKHVTSWLAFDDPRCKDLGLLIVRLFFGCSMAFAHGLGKLPPSDQLVSSVEGLGFPLPTVFAWAAALSEFAGALLIAIGFLTRPAAAMLLITMAVAAFLVHAADPYQKKEMALMYGTVALALLVAGPGRYSADNWAFGKREY